MKDSKLLLGLAVGVAVGAAIGYLAATDKKEQILDELNVVIGKVKEGFNSTVSKFKDKGCTCNCTTSDECAVAE